MLRDYRTKETVKELKRENCLVGKGLKRDGRGFYSQTFRHGSKGNWRRADREEVMAWEQAE